MLKLIVDTDIGSDCDDAGALAVMHRLADEGLCDVLAVTHSLSRASGPAAIDAINRYYGREDIPVGTLKYPGYYPAHVTAPYSDALQREYENAYPPGVDCPDAVSLLRRLLAAQPDGSVELVAIGPLTNIRFLLESPPDTCSPLSGEELLNRKLRRMCCMGGYFQIVGPHRRGAPVGGEFNIVSDVPSARITVERLRVPLVFSPWETGAQIVVGRRLLERADPENPVYRSYQLFCGCPRESWDLCTVLYAVCPDDKLWELSPPGVVTISEQGVTAFREAPDGLSRILYARDPARIRLLLEDMLLYEPRRIRQLA